MWDIAAAVGGYRIVVYPFCAGCEYDEAWENGTGRPGG